MSQFKNVNEKRKKNKIKTKPIIKRSEWEHNGKKSHCSINLPYLPYVSQYCSKMKQIETYATALPFFFFVYIYFKLIRYTICLLVDLIRCRWQCLLFSFHILTKTKKENKPYILYIYRYVFISAWTRECGNHWHLKHTFLLKCELTIILFLDLTQLF